MHLHSQLRILVISYTNHALDQFLEDLLDRDIPCDHMVRLGSKSTMRTASLQLPRSSIGGKRSQDSWSIINKLKLEQSTLGEELRSDFRNYLEFSVSFVDLLEYLEFSEMGSRFYNAFIVPSAESDWKRIGRGGRQVQPSYLFDSWRTSGGPGIFTNQVTPDAASVWNMNVAMRHELLGKWVETMVQERVENIQNLVQKLDDTQGRLDDLFNEGKIEYLRSKRIIGCTTTAAAMHTKIIHEVNPDVVLVEEAGEILESHIITALTPSVKQLVLIGDHKQLRPKVNNYALTAEKGDGFDLNVSLFERMVKQDYSYTALQKQHRMHPEISLFPRSLTYPELLDAPKTNDHPSILGLQDRVIFVNHEHAETGVEGVTDRRDPDAKASKENEFEAVEILRIVKYLAQQGYSSTQLVVLTPYLGQLRLLRDKLATETDPILNDIDASELLRAGLLTQAASKVGKQPLRLSTIGKHKPQTRPARGCAPSSRMCLGIKRRLKDPQSYAY